MTNSSGACSRIPARVLSPSEPMISNNVCLNAHPAGCAASVRAQAAWVSDRPRIQGGPTRVLVLGCSTGYGLASRIVSAFNCRAATLGVSLERPGAPAKSGTPGFYNNREFDRLAAEAGLFSATFNADAYSEETKREVIQAIHANLGSVDMVVYSLASPVRKDPSGRVWQSSIKPIGAPYAGRLVDVKSGAISEVEIQPATEDEIQGCVKVMGGEDWILWIDALAQAGVLAEGATTVAYSYVGPALSYPIYRSGTLGRAKEDLEASATALRTRYASLGLRALVSVNKALVTRASVVIPSIPLYVMALYKAMKARGSHEGCIQQIDRLFRDFLYSGDPLSLDDAGRVRIDDRELDPLVQAEVQRIMSVATQDNLADVADFEGFRADFLEANGFGLAGVDYSAPVSYE